jgi:hypothetical protein
MSSNATPKPPPGPPGKPAAKATDNSLPQPPAEEFWHRYSPHYEAPISGVGSLVVHLIPFALFLAMVILGIGLSNRSKIEFEAVRLPGGGGGNPNGRGDGPGVGNAPLVEDTNNLAKEETTDNLTPLNDRPPLDPTKVAEVKRMFDSDPDAMRFINSGNQNFDAIAKNLNQDILGKIRDGMTPGKGQGGPGSGGGEGKGKGTGTGPNTGAGKGTLTEREKRMLRWVMVFETQNPHDYVKQLAGLGAILAIPTGSGQYKLIKDLMHPQLVDEDVASLNRIYWVDDKPQSVASVLQILKVSMRPTHFVAFMPQELEQRLGEMERQYQSLAEDEIYETKFKVFRTPNGYDVKVINQSRK